MARDYIEIVGSSTVYPFTTVVAERFGRTTVFRTPKVEATGTGGGFKAFCQGLGFGHPDIVSASRAMKPAEFAQCHGQGIDQILEVTIGFDGIVLGQANQTAAIQLTRAQVFLALAERVPSPEQPTQLIPNPYQRWSDIDPALPARAIEVYGPPPTSGTRDAFVQLVVAAGCQQITALASESTACNRLREDGRYIEMGENDNLILRKLQLSPAALGIFGFSFLDQNQDQISAAAIDGNKPTFNRIAQGAYPVSRPLFLYLKTEHIGVVPGIDQFLIELTSERAWGDAGYLAVRGLVPLPKNQRQAQSQRIQTVLNSSLAAGP
jgi:phosphate transport system substrate-binding protein